MADISCFRVGAVLAPLAVLGAGELHPAGPHSLHQPAEVGQIVRMHQLGRAVAQQLLRSVAQHLAHRGRDVEPHAVQVAAHQRVGVVLGDQSVEVALLARLALLGERVKMRRDQMRQVLRAPPARPA